MTPAPEYVIVYLRGPGYGLRHRVLARRDGRVTVQNLSTGETLVVHPCDTEPAQ